MAKSKLEKSIEETAKLAEAEEKEAIAEPEEKVEEIVEPPKEEKPNEDGSDDDQGDGKEQAEQEKEDGEGKGGGDGEAEKPPEIKDEVLDPKEAAFLRRENRRLKARAEAVATKPAVAEAPVVRKEPEDPMPDRSLDPDGYRDWKDRQLDAKLDRIDKFTEGQRKEKEQAETYQRAGAELNGYVETFSKEVPELKAVLNHAAGRWKQSFKDINPKISDVEVEAAFGKFALMQAAEALNRGEDPAESLYNMALERYGRPAAPVKETPKQPEKQKINLARIDASRRKSATPLQGGGQGSENMTLTKAAVAAMPLHEFAQIDERTLRQLEGEPD